ncbi:MAG: isochorismatase family protein, partial [Deltaproteobacteria bacterium]|nr:isochorismatase family protein [Deltaproteobacteria bacterium]
MKLLSRESTGLLVVDVQEKLMPVMGKKQRVIDNIITLLKLSKIFELPVILTEQYPKWLGPTIPEIREHLLDVEPFTKYHFNCCDAEGFNDPLDSGGFKNLIVTGVESHICIYQTCVSISGRGYQV